MIENEIYCHINGFLKWNISKKTGYVVGNKKFSGKICILNLRNKRKSIFTDTSKFKKFNEDSTLKREGSLQQFLCKLTQKNLFNENEYDKSYPSGSASARIYGTLNMHKFSSADSFLNFIQLFHPMKLYIRRNNNKVDSIETRRIVIAHLLP